MSSSCHSSATSGSGPARAACSSTQNAGGAVPSTRLVRVTHPFHPLRGQEFICVGERCNRYGVRLLLSVGADTVCAVPQQWTNLAAPDPAVIIGAERALMRVADLVELARLVARVSECDSHNTPEKCQANCAANVSKNTPHGAGDSESR